MSELRARYFFKILAKKLLGAFNQKLLFFEISSKIEILRWITSGETVKKII